MRSFTVQTVVPFFETEAQSMTLTKGVDDLSEDRIIKRNGWTSYGKTVIRNVSTNVSKDVMLEVKNWTVHHPLLSGKNL